MEKNYRDGLLLRSSNHHRSETRSTSTTTSSDFVLQWGNRKRLRCMKVHHNKNSGAARAEHDDNSEPSGSAPAQRTTGRPDRRVARSDPNRDPSNYHGNNTAVSNGYLNLRQRPASPSHRILRNSDSSIAMRERSNGLRNLASPDKGGAAAHDKRGGGGGAHNSSSNNNNNHTRANHNNDNNNHHHHGGGAGGSVSSETAHESKKGGGSSSGSDAIPAVWPPKFVIALTNKEKEEDFMAIKGSKLPQRPKKRAKFIQRTLNLISPGAWLCDLSLERYEVREKKVSKKRPRGLKAMGNMDSDSE